MNRSESTILKTRWGYVGLVWGSSGLRKLTLPYSRLGDCQKIVLAEVMHKNLKDVSPKIRNLCALIEKYFEGDKVQFERNVNFDWQSLTKSQIRVLKVALEIPYGEKLSYSELAEKSGFPGGARFVGNTLGKNPFPLLIPCHRIISKNNSLGGFSAPQGKGLKLRMLQLENCNLFG